MMLFPKALFLGTTLPQVAKNSIFLLHFYQKFSQNLQTICVFRPNARKINAEFINLSSKQAKIMHFLLLSQENFQNFLNSFPSYCVFRPNELKINAGFVILFGKNRLKLCIYCNFLKNFFKIFENSPASGGLRPLTPYQADPLKCPPPRKVILAAPLLCI